MKDWFELFLANNNKIILTLKGKTFKKSDCLLLGGGSEKMVYQIKGTNQCFFIPNKIEGEMIWAGIRISSEYSWNKKIQSEKYFLDQISDLGLKTQRFEILPLKIEEPGNSSHTLNVLVTQDFNSLCEEESIAIYNVKGNQKITGNPPNFIEMKEQFKDKIFVQKMFEKIISEYAVAITFSLPISILHALDDSQHLCFELPKDAMEPPIARYMFWDVVSDFSGVDIPIVPTLDELKSSSSEKFQSVSPGSLQGLSFLANEVACAMIEMSSTKDGTYKWDHLREIEKNFFMALNDDEFLNNALGHARKLAFVFIENLLNKKEFTDKINKESFILLMRAALSVGELDLVIRAFQVLENPTELPQERIDKIMSTAQKYKVQPIIDYLNIHLIQEKIRKEAEKVNAAEEKLHRNSEPLTSNVLHRNTTKWATDKSAWSSLYSFFAKSCVNNKMNLTELVEPVQVHSNQDSGNRSQEILKQT